MQAEARFARERFERQAEAASYAAALDQEVAALNSAAAQEASADRARTIVSENSYEYPAHVFGMQPVTEYSEDNIARTVMDLARQDPLEAAEVASEVLAQLPADAAERVDQYLQERLEFSRLAEFTLDTRSWSAPRNDVTPAEAAQAANEVLAESYRTGVIGRAFGTEPRLDTDAIVEGLLDIRDQNPDLAVSAHRDIASRITPAQADALDEALAAAPHAPGVAVAYASPESLFRDTVLGRVAAGMVGDPIAVVGQAVRSDGLAVNPLTGDILSGGRLQDAREMAVLDAASAGLAGRLSGALRLGDEVVGAGARALDEAAAVTDEAVETSVDVLQNLGARRAGELPGSAAGITRSPDAQDIASIRAQHGLDDADTVAAARTDIPGLDGADDLFGGISPGLRERADLPDLDELHGLDRPIISPRTNPQFTRHAEEDVLNALSERIDALPESATSGRTVEIHISNETGVCTACFQGLPEESRAAPGVIRQFSERYPDLTLRITAEGGTARSNIDPLTVRGGRIVDN